MVNSRLSSKHPQELYSERERVIAFFEDTDEFDLYGKYWEKRRYRNWKGIVSDKIGTIQNYKFIICYENMRDIAGYVTEKIFDAFAARVVPIYWGCSNITDYVPKECFIDRRDFKDFGEVYTFLHAMTEEEYEGYLAAAGRFLQSEGAQRFSKESFIQTVMEVLAP